MPSLSFTPQLRTRHCQLERKAMQGQGKAKRHFSSKINQADQKKRSRVCAPGTKKGGWDLKGLDASHPLAQSQPRQADRPRRLRLQEDALFIGRGEEIGTWVKRDAEEAKLSWARAHSSHEAKQGVESVHGEAPGEGKGNERLRQQSSRAPCQPCREQGVQPESTAKKWRPPKWFGPSGATGIACLARSRSVRPGSVSSQPRLQSERLVARQLRDMRPVLPGAALLGPVEP